MAKTRNPKPETRNPTKFPWLPLILLLASIYVFWILPMQLPKPELKIEFEPTANGRNPVGP